MANEFNKDINRLGTDCFKWDFLERLYKRDDITSMWVADSDYKAPEPVLERMRQRLDHGVFGYTGVGDDFYTSFIDWCKRRHNYEIKKEWIVPTPGIVPSINWLIHALTNEGDKIIIQTPVYYPFFSAVTGNKRVLIENALIEEDGKYTMDFDGLINSIDEQTKMIILCNPHNPVGRVFKKEELERLGEICINNDIIIVSDEIHSDLVYKPHKHIPIASLSEALNNQTITLMAPSKTFNIAGLKASVFISANKTYLNAFKAFQTSIGMGLMNIFGIEAFSASYEAGEQWLEDQLVHLKGNIDYFKNFIQENLPTFKVVETEGTYLLWLDARCLDMTTKEMKDFFTNQVKVALNHGEKFGETGKGFMRFNLATSRNNVVDVLNNLKSAYESLNK